MPIDIERRAFVQSGVLLAGRGALGPAPPPATAQTPNLSPSGAKQMTYAIKPMSFDPKKIRGLSEKILKSHYENNYGGAVKRLNTITEQLTGLDYTKAPGFLINGLKREELIAANSMILHELYFAGLGDEHQPGAALPGAVARGCR